jgi:hypothetical protein
MSTFHSLLAERIRAARDPSDLAKAAPAWPPAEQPRRVGRATRVRDTGAAMTPQPSTAWSSALLPPLVPALGAESTGAAQDAGSGQPLSVDTSLASLAPDASGSRDAQIAAAAEAMSHSPSCPMARLVERTRTVGEWTPGKKIVAAPASDSGGSVVRPEPLIIRAKLRRGCQNQATTEMIAAAVVEREAQRERAAAVIENGRSFHAPFSAQPVAAVGTAHVKPLWSGARAGPAGPQALPDRPAQRPRIIGGRLVFEPQPLPGGARSTPSPAVPQPLPRSLQALDPQPSGVAAFSPLGLPGVGEADCARQRHHGKQQFAGARDHFTAILPGQRSVAPDAASQGIASHPFHSRPHDGSRGVRVSGGEAFFGAPRRDQVQEAFAAHPARLPAPERHKTTSSAIGSGGGGGDGDGPQARHVPLVGAPSLALRSRTPAPAW